MDFVPKYKVDGIRKFHDELHSYPESPSRSDCMVCCCLLELERFEKDQEDIQIQRDTWEDRETKYMIRIAQLEKEMERRAMNNMQFRAYLDLLMASDPWPLDVEAQIRLLDVADEESTRRGFLDWVQAYHDFDGATPDTEESMPVITKPS